MTAARRSLDFPNHVWIRDDKYSLRNIFTSRNQDKFFNPKDLQNELGFSQYPDRIIGLRETNNFSRILNSYAQDGCKVRDSIRVSPLSSQKGEHLLFPFMALEAKKDEQDSWKDIYNQTVVPIFTMLNDQRHVLKALSTHVKRFGPTVWFFLTRGAEWRLYLAYQSEQDPEDGSAPVKSHEGVVTVCSSPTTVCDQCQRADPMQRSFEVWRGSVDNPDHALQLLLIVDIMLDWGRDIYRKQILSSLVIIAQSDDTLSRIDSNIFSQGATPLVGSVEINNSILQSSRLATAAPVPDPAMLNAPIINQTPLDSPERQIPTMLQQEMLYSQTTQFSPSAYFQPEYVSSVYPMQYQSIPACQHLKVETKLISVVLSTEMIVNCLQRLNHWLASHQIPGILNDLQTVLDNELRTNLLDDMIDLFLHATEPRMELSLQELMEIFKVWLGQPMAYDPASSDQPFLVSCRAAYSMDLAFSVHRDLYVITMDRNALQMLCENLLQITKNSVQLRRRYEADIGSYSVPPPSEIPSAIQRLLALPASKNLDLASRGACLTCTVDGGLCDNSWAPNLMTELQRWGVLSFPFVLCYSRTEFQQMSN